LGPPKKGAIKFLSNSWRKDWRSVGGGASARVLLIPAPLMGPLSFLLLFIFPPSLTLADFPSPSSRFIVGVVGDSGSSQRPPFASKSLKGVEAIYAAREDDVAVEGVTAVSFICAFNIIHVERQ
jgi:hypothetical protein